MLHPSHELGAMSLQGLLFIVDSIAFAARSSSLPLSRRYFPFVVVMVIVMLFQAIASRN